MIDEQNAERRHAARKEAAARRRERERLSRSATIIQREARRWSAGRRVRLLQAIRRAEEAHLRKKRAEEAAAEAFQREGAALVLQRKYRTLGYWALARQFIEVKRRERVEKAKNWARRWRAIVRVRILRRAKQRRDERRRIAATTMQVGR